ncbi:MAG: magnesium transporter [Deltaproteobacteria bacterium]|nr:MAG: magnesium transporter [Deltaproteobacteria bacterium]
MDRLALTPEIHALIQQQSWPALRELLEEYTAADIADLMLEISAAERLLVFRCLPRDLGSEVFSHLDVEEQDELIRQFTDQETRHVLATMTPDDRTALFEELPAEVTVRLLNMLDPEDLREAKQLLGYPDESAGRLMTPDYVAIRAHWTVARALDHIRKYGHDRESINIVYVRDAHGRLLDELRLRQIVLAPADATVSELMDRSVISLSAFDDREVAVRLMRKYDISALPVVDSEGVLLGMVTFDDVLDVAEEEATEDIHKGASVAPLRMSYDRAPITLLYGKRIGWLTLLVIMALASSGVIAIFEETLEAHIALALFMPLLIDSSGNVGSQSATLMIRALVTDDVKLNQWARVLFKEFGVGLLLGVTLGALSALLGIFRGDWMIGVVVGLTMVSVVLFANLVGTILPFILTKLRLDPATASAPLITTIADASGLFIYFSIASVVLGI